MDRYEYVKQIKEDLENWKDKKDYCYENIFFLDLEKTLCIINLFFTNNFTKNIQL